MARITRPEFWLGSQLIELSLYPRLLLISSFVLCLSLRAESQKASTQQGSTTSMTEAVKRMDRGETELHIFYVHGMGINPPKGNQNTQTFETSQEFRTSFCKLLHCTNKIADQFEKREYAHTGPFAPAATPPYLLYLGKEIWRTKDKDGNPNNDDWRAAAPFVDHYKLERQGGPAIHLHEINWWPLVLSAKCRQIVAKEAALIGPDDQHIKICSAHSEHDGDIRFKAYQWITSDDIAPHNPSSPGPAPFNRSQKAAVLDWGFSDAVLSLGPLRDSLVTGIREIVRDTHIETVKAAARKGNNNPEFIVVSHSLGSYLMFTALDLPSNAPDAEVPDWKQDLDDLLRRTSHAYFMANQISLLELANLDKTSKGNLITHLQTWSDFRAESHSTATIDAFSDPSDWLTWQVPDNEKVNVTNHSVKNARHWFWYFENPASAHLDYDKNKSVLRAMLPKD